MKQVELNGHKVLLYTSIEELPIVRFHKYNKMMLVDAGIGSDLSAMDGHIERVVEYIRRGNRDEAATEMENLRQNVYMIIQQMSPKMLSFCCLVKEIDGVSADDISDEGLKKVSELLSDVSVREMTAQQDAVKKKIDDELTAYFPQVFNDNRGREFYDILKERIRVMLKCITDGDTEERKEEVERLTGNLVTFQKPRKFTGSNSTEIEYDREFDDMCLVISKETGTEAKRMTVMEYYNAYLFITKERKRQKTQNKAR